MVKKSACSAGDKGSISGLERSPAEENGIPLQYSCLENPVDPRSLVGCRPWGHKELGMTEWLTLWLILCYYLSACTRGVVWKNLSWMGLNYVCFWPRNLLPEHWCYKRMSEDHLISKQTGDKPTLTLHLRKSAVPFCFLLTTFNSILLLNKKSIVSQTEFPFAFLTLLLFVFYQDTGRNKYSQIWIGVS